MADRMKLYRVTVEYEYFVVAKDEDEAWDVARESRSQASFDADDPDLFVVSEVSDERTVASEWLTSFPYGGDGDSSHTCRWYLRNQEPEPFIDTLTTDMFKERT